MRRLNDTWRNTGLAAMTVAAAGLLASTAAATTFSAEQLNAGPSSDQLPTAAGDNVATLRYPRVIVDSDIPDVSGAIGATLADATLIQEDGVDDMGLRLRSIAVLEGVNINANASFEVLAQSSFDVDADESYIVFMNFSDAEGITTLADLEAFAGAGSSLAGTGVSGTDFIKVLFDGNAAGGTDLGIADAQMTAAFLANGRQVAVSTLEAVDPGAAGAGDGAAGQWKNFEVAIIVLEDVAGGNQTTDIVTEWICIGAGDRVAPVDAAFDQNNQVIRVATNLQTEDDDAAQNPGDTNDAGLAAATDLRVRDSGGTLNPLSTFLANLNDANTVASFNIAGPNKNILEINLTNQVTDDADIAEILGSQIGFFSTSQVFGVAGNNPNGSTSTFQIMDRAGDLVVEDAFLLQGNGPVVGEGAQREIWMEINFDQDVSSAGDADQFALVNEDGDIVAVSDMVTATAPGSGAVPGIDDEDLDGTADDPVTEASADRLYARFALGDPNDAINSDGTWSNQASGTPSLRSERQSLTLAINTGVTPTTAGTSLGGGIADDSETPVEDNARPLAIQFLTQAGSTGSFCEFVDGLKWVFDEAVSGLSAGQLGLAFDSGATISDLTDGLGSGFSIPTIDLATEADFEDTLLNVSGTAQATMYVANDSVTLSAPELPADGTTRAGGTSLRSGTGDTAYIGGLNANAVEGGENLGNSAVGTFDDPDGGDLTAGPTVADGAAPAFMAASLSDGNVTMGHSEDVTSFGPSTTEAESYVFAQDGDSSTAVRENLSGATFNFGGVDNITNVNNTGLDPEIAHFMAYFNPGWGVSDLNNNRIDPIVAKTKLVELTPPSAEFKSNGIAFVDDETNKVVTIVLQTMGPVDISGSESELFERFFVRGDDNGNNNGLSMELGDLIDDITISTEPRASGCYTFTLSLVDDCPLTQEDFFVEYLDSLDQPEPSTSTLVDADNGVEVPSADVYVNVARPQTPSPDGNPLTETYVGTLDLGSSEESALGARIEAFVYKSVSECGILTFTYKGVVYTGEIAGLSDSTGLPIVGDGAIRYFHPQLKGEEDEKGTMVPCGIINSKPDVDLYQVATLEGTQEGFDGDNSDGINADEAAEFIETTQQVLLYQNLDPSLVIRPIQMTFRRDTTNPRRFTVTGTGISNGAVVFDGEFDSIGATYVTSDPNEDGEYPWILHTRGQKNYLGCPVVFVVCPDENFSDVGPFLANNTVVGRVSFAADNQADVTTAGKSFTFANNAPRFFEINRNRISEFNIADWEQDNWAIFPVNRTNAGFGATTGNDFFRTSAANLPNRVSTISNNVATPLNSTSQLPTNTTARGFFTVLSKSSKRPEILPIATALAIDTRGVYCGSAASLDRIAAGYAYAIEFRDDENWSNYCFYTFGDLLSEVTAAVLNVTPNASNGGWSILTNTSGGSLTGDDADDITGSQIIISMNGSEGVRIFVEGEPDFSDLEAVLEDAGFMLFTDTAFTN